MTKLGDVTFSAEERQRLAKACQVLGVKFHEFVHFATLQALDEVESETMGELREAKEAAK